MTVIDILALVAAFACVAAYARGGRVFDWANATMWPVIGLSALLRGAWGPVVLTVSFGVTGVWKLYRGRGHRRRIMELRFEAKTNRVLRDLAGNQVMIYRDIKL